MAIFTPDFKLTFQLSRRTLLLWLLGGIISVFSSITIFIIIFFNYYHNRIYQGIFINNINVGGLTKLEALHELKQAKFSLKNKEVILQAENFEENLQMNDLASDWQYDPAINQALKIGHQEKLLNELQAIFKLLHHPQYLTLYPEINLAQINASAKKLKDQIDDPAIEPILTLGQSGSLDSLSLETGKDGKELNIEATAETANTMLRNDLALNINNVSNTKNLVIPAVVELIEAELNAEEQSLVKARAKKIIGEKISFTSAAKLNQDQFLGATNGYTYSLNDQDLITFLDLPQGYKNEVIEKRVADWNETLSHPAQNAIFEYDPDTLKVKNFKAPAEGLNLDSEQTVNLIKNSLNILENGSEEEIETLLATSQLLPLTRTQPETTLAETNDLGINALIGSGDSHYAHSIPARIHNVKITADRLSLNIVPPGEEFSFNQAIGEVSSATGYKAAYIIQNGRTVLGGGGGVCQVSTTLFRALLDAGLDITKRLPHSYRVSYYELDKKPGFDATVYAGDVDLRFINDTPNHILIYSEADSENLYMRVEIYGTDDGRTTEISNYEKWGYRGPPAPQYIPSTDLAPGQIKQIDWAVSGIKTSFDWTVRDADGNIIREKTYYSNYRPWSAKYLQGV